jgi:hypothetical protein
MICLSVKKLETSNVGIRHEQPQLFFELHWRFFFTVTPRMEKEVSADKEKRKGIEE